VNVFGLAGPANAAEAVQPKTAQAMRGFADLVEKVKPSVVSVRVKMDGPVRQTSMNDDESVTPFRPGSPMERFFKNSPMQKFFGEGLNSGPNTKAEPRRALTGVGSGFFISADGYAVTNNHVVDHATEVQVTADDGAIYSAKVIGTDAATDLALIKVDGKTNFSHVQFAERPPRIGDWVVTVGNPFGLGGTVTAGIVSASGRDIGAGPYDYIQIDAPINKGNSGGPTFDVDGSVIGVNTAIFSPSGGSVGIGFDVPAETAKMVIAQLKDNGHVTRGWLGVQLQSVTPEIADGLGMKEARGALVAEVQANSPAAKSELKAGDVITTFNGTAVKDSRDVARRVATLNPGSSVTFDVTRGGQSKTITLALGERTEQRPAKNDRGQTSPNADTPHLGLSLAPAGEVAGAGNKGVVVTEVEPNGPAADHGFKTGDVILDISGKTVSSVSDVRQALKDAKAQGKKTVLIRVTSDNATKFVAVPFANG
jgi:serine protease Do